MDSEEEEYEWIPERQLQGKSKHHISCFLGMTSSLRFNHHHMQAKEQPIQYISDYIMLYYTQNMNDFLCKLIKSYRIPKT